MKKVHEAITKSIVHNSIHIPVSLHFSPLIQIGLERFKMCICIWNKTAHLIRSISIEFLNAIKLLFSRPNLSSFNFIFISIFSSIRIPQFTFKHLNIYCYNSVQMLLFVYLKAAPPFSVQCLSFGHIVDIVIVMMCRISCMIFK